MKPEDTLPPAVTALPSHGVMPRASLPRDALRQLAQRRGARWIEVELAACADKAAVMAALARAFAFPEWFGANYDALFDALTDLPAEPGWLILLEGLLVSGADRDTRDAFLDVFRDAAEDFADRGGGEFRVFYS